MAEPPKSYESLLDVAETIDILAEPPRSYESSIEYSESINILAEPPRTFESLLAIIETVDVLVEPPRSFVASLDVIDILVVIAEAPKTFEVLLTIVEKADLTERIYGVQLGVIESVSTEIYRVFEVSINVYDTISRLAVFDIHGLEKIVSSMRYLVPGDIMDAIYHNVVVDALKKQADIIDYLVSYLLEENA